MPITDAHLISYCVYDNEAAIQSQKIVLVIWLLCLFIFADVLLRLDHIWIYII